MSIGVQIYGFGKTIGLNMPIDHIRVPLTHKNVGYFLFDECKEHACFLRFQ
jgi:hypothetical protein